MATLTAAKRKKLKPSQFAGPGRSYPIPDKTHKARATQQVAKGNLAPSTAAKIKTRANRVLGNHQLPPTGR